MLSRRTAIAALSGMAASLMARPAWSNDTAELDAVAPELRPFAIELQKMLRSLPAFSRESLPGLRGMWKKFAEPPLSTVPWTKQIAPGSNGNPDVTLYVINAKPGLKRGGIVYIHGGGYVSGGAAPEMKRSQMLAETLDCAIIVVDYRLAPEVRYAGSMEDNYAALRWLHTHADSVGVDPEKIAVMGDSAGGGHAALLAQLAKDRGEYPIRFQCLVYPMLDDRTGTIRKVPGNVGKFAWTAEQNAFGWSSFLGRAPGSTETSGVPGRRADLAGLPPAWIGVGGIDLFVEEDIDYAKRLVEADVPVELLVVPGAFHGFDVIAGKTDIAARFNAGKIAALRRAFADG